MTEQSQQQPVKKTEPEQAHPVRAVGNEVHETRAAEGNHETRQFSTGEVRAVAGKPNQFVARVCNYGVADTYGTSWAPGVFTESLRTKLPKAVWSHDWNRPIGHVVSYDDTAKYLDVTVQLANPDDVPDARMTRSLLTPDPDTGIATIDNFSFGFVRKADRPDPNLPGITQITKAEMDEVSPVLVGSVPGTRTLAVRSGAPIEARAAADIITRFSSGELDLADALVELKTQATRAVVSEASMPASTTGALPTVKAAGRTMKRTPHAYKATNGEGSVCKTCGGLAKFKAHSLPRGASAGEIRALTIDIAGDQEDTSADSPEELVAATDAAIDAAITLASYQDLTNLPWWVAQMLALIMAADCSIDAAMVALGVPDPDEQVINGMVRSIQDDHEKAAPAAPEQRAPQVDALANRLGRLAR